MSAAPKYPNHLSYAGLRMTAEEFLSLGETPERLELIDGVVTVSPKPSFRHQRVAFLIARAIDDWAAHHPGAQMAQDVSVQFGPSIVYEPDIVAFAPGTYDREPAIVDRPPDLVVEVSSPSTMRMDQDTKKRDYERFRCQGILVDRSVQWRSTRVSARGRRARGAVWPWHDHSIVCAPRLHPGPRSCAADQVGSPILSDHLPR
jgi:Uma2 family endonuclease